MFSGIALAGALAVFLATDAPIASYELPSGRLGLALLVVSVLYVLLLARTRSVTSVGDVDGIPLEPARIRSAMAIGLLAALSGPTAETTAYVWSAIAGSAIAGLRRLR